MLGCGKLVSVNVLEYVVENTWIFGRYIPHISGFTYLTYRDTLANGTAMGQFWGPREYSEKKPRSVGYVELVSA